MAFTRKTVDSSLKLVQATFSCLLQKTERRHSHPFCTGAYRRQMRIYSSLNRSVYPNSQRHHEWVKIFSLASTSSTGEGCFFSRARFHFCGVFYVESSELNMNRSLSPADTRPSLCSYHEQGDMRYIRKHRLQPYTSYRTRMTVFTVTYCING